MSGVPARPALAAGGAGAPARSQAGTCGSLRECRSCHYQFSVTVCTVMLMQDSKLPRTLIPRDLPGQAVQDPFTQDDINGAPGHGHRAEQVRLTPKCCGTASARPRGRACRFGSGSRTGGAHRSPYDDQVHEANAC